jgi:Zn-dependent peptidase ImmA (M78 family)
VKPFLSIKCERVPQPQAADAAEAATWASFRMYAAGRCITRWWDRDCADEKDEIYIPAWPVARWIVQNWWPLLNEASPTESIPASAAAWTPAERAWVQRHCLRSAESGVFLPKLFLFNDGQYFNANWVPDGESDYPSMPGYFLYGSSVQVSVQETEQELRTFVNTVLRWLEKQNVREVERVRENWDAIVNADPEEVAFCRASGRMGLDPYSASSWPEDLVTTLEGASSDSRKDLVGDWLDVASPVNAKASWDWVAHAANKLKLMGAPQSRVRPTSYDRVGGQAGFLTALKLKSDLGLDPSAPVTDLSRLAEGLGIGEYSLQLHNHVPSPRIRAAVGWRSQGKPVIAGPAPTSLENKRFVEARGLYHALFGAKTGPRLVTTAHTWDQQVSRGFAAEILAPRSAVLSRLEQCQDEQEQGEVAATLAKELGVSSELVERQWWNGRKYGLTKTN